MSKHLIVVSVDAMVYEDLEYAKNLPAFKRLLDGGDSVASVAEKMKLIPEVVECHFITGTYTAMVKLYCVDNEHLMRTIFDNILRIQGVTKTQTYISLNEAFSREPHIDYLDR